jgi:hypothetical protein
MRRITWIVLSGLVALALPSASLAQRAGVGAAHAGTAAAHGISPGSAHFLPPPRVGTAGFGTIPPASPGYTGIRSGALRSYGYRGRDFRRVPYAYFFAPYYYPFLDYGSSGYPDYGYDPGPDPGAQSAVMAENMMGDQINRLSAEVEQLKYAQAPQPPPYATREDPQPAQPPVTLVLRNGQQLQVQNYAVMDQTFWDFSTQPTRKIPIANIDVAASAKATAASGGEFPQLETEDHKGQ